MGKYVPMLLTTTEGQPWPQPREGRSCGPNLCEHCQQRRPSGGKLYIIWLPKGAGIIWACDVCEKVLCGGPIRIERLQQEMAAKEAREALDKRRAGAYDGGK